MYVLSLHIYICTYIYIYTPHIEINMPWPHMASHLRQACRAPEGNRKSAGRDLEFEQKTTPRQQQGILRLSQSYDFNCCINLDM